MLSRNTPQQSDAYHHTCHLPRGCNSGGNSLWLFHHRNNQSTLKARPKLVPTATSAVCSDRAHSRRDPAACARRRHALEALIGAVEPGAEDKFKAAQAKEERLGGVDELTPKDIVETEHRIDQSNSGDIDDKLASFCISGPSSWTPCTPPSRSSSEGFAHIECHCSQCRIKTEPSVGSLHLTGPYHRAAFSTAPLCGVRCSRGDWKTRWQAA